MSAAVDKGRVRRHFSLHANDYDSVTPVQAEMGAELLRLADEHRAGRATSRILELGCGTGRLTERLRVSWPSAAITAVDLSAEMLAHARRRLGDAPRTTWLQADAEALPEQLAGGLSLIISNAMIQWLDEPAATLERLRRLAAPGATIALSGFLDGTFRELAESFAEAERELGREPSPHLMPLLTADAWRRHVAAIGAVAHFSESDRVSRHPSLRDFLRSLKLTGATHAGARPAVPVDRALHRRLHALYSQRHAHPQGGVAVTWRRLLAIIEIPA